MTPLIILEFIRNYERNELDRVDICRNFVIQTLFVIEYLKMKFFPTAALFFVGFLVFIAMPENNFADAKPTASIPPPGPNEEYKCGTTCPNSCENPNAEDGPCSRMCKRGNFCVAGYIRDTSSGLCILPSECSPSVDLSDNIDE